MLAQNLKLLIAALFVLCLGSLPASAEDIPFTEKLATPALLKALQAGGYVLYMRHGVTDNSIPDRVPEVDLNDCSTQRPLTEEGREQFAALGKAMRAARIPTGEILSSPMCRSKQSARAAFGPNFRVEPLLLYTANMTRVEKTPALNFLRSELTRKVPAGRNRIIVSHAPNLMDLIGYFPKEATVVVFKPAGNNGYEYLASIAIEQWPDLLRQTFP